MLRTIYLPKNQNFKKMVGLKVHGNLKHDCALTLFPDFPSKVTLIINGHLQYMCFHFSN